MINYQNSMLNWKKGLKTIYKPCTWLIYGPNLPSKRLKPPLVDQLWCSSCPCCWILSYSSTLDHFWVNWSQEIGQKSNLVGKAVFAKPPHFTLLSSKHLPRAILTSSGPILVIFGPRWGFLNVSSCFRSFPSWSRPIQGVKLGSKVHQAPIFKSMPQDPKGGILFSRKAPLGNNFFGLSMHFPHQLGPINGKIAGPERYLTFMHIGPP